MALSHAVRPHRSLAFPFVVVLFPFLWFVVRDAGIAATTGSANPARALALAAGAVVTSYVAAAAVVATLGIRRGSVPAWTTSLLRPSNATLAVFGAISLALGGYVVVGSAVAFPQWFESVAALVGVVLGWPLVAVYAGTVAVGNAVGTQLPFAVETTAVGVGVALSASWLFVLSGWFVAVLVGTATVSETTPY